MVHDVVGEDSGLSLNELVDGVLDCDVVPKHVIQGVIDVYAEDVWEESMVAQILADVGVVNNALNAQRIKVVLVADSGELENLWGADGACRQDNFLARGDASQTS